VFLREASELTVVEVFESQAVDVQAGVGGGAVEDGHGRVGGCGEVHGVVLAPRWLRGWVSGGEIGGAYEADSKTSKSL